MANSYLNIVTFLLTTIFYYFILKPKLTYDVFTDEKKMKEYKSNNYMYLAIYMLLVITVQFFVNVSSIVDKCGGSFSENIGVASLLTFIPWTIIFGSIIIILTIYPSFKGAFADVVGYFYVSNSANKVLTDLLVNKEVQDKMNSDPNVTQEQKDAMQQSADVIVKIFGNNSVLINQIVPSNFNDYWSILTPLMKPEYRDNSVNGSAEEQKKKLFDLVVSRENVGEAMWYTYTGILLTSLVQLKMTTQGCVVSPKTMEKNYQKFLDEEAKAQEERDKATSTTYTVTT